VEAAHRLSNAFRPETRRICKIIDDFPAEAAAVSVG
jgi:hypothetical protein